jgi:hypothetical protein
MSTHTASSAPPGCFSSNFLLTCHLQVISLSCSTAANASRSCKLTVYCHDMGGFTCSTAKGNMSLARLPAVTALTDPLNRTEDNRTMTFKDPVSGKQNTSRLVVTPLLYFHGGPRCHVVLKGANVQNVDVGMLPDPKDSTQVSSHTTKTALARSCLALWEHAVSVVSKADAKLQACPVV